MMTTLRVVFLSFVLVGTPLGAVQQIAHAAEDGGALMRSDEGLRVQEAEKFRQWRESIPDYEKRLYDRVKTLNSRVIRLTNIVIVGFALLLIFAPLGLYLVISQVGAAPLPAQGPAGEDSSGDVRALQRPQREHQRVLDRQNEIRRLLTDMQGFLRAYEASLEDLSRDKARIDGVIGKCAAMVEEIGSRMTDKGDRS